MSGKVFAAVCILASIVQSISAQCCGQRVATIPVPSCGCSPSTSCSNYGFSKTTTASTGGPLTVTCYGPLSTNGVSVYSNLDMNGQLEVTGSLPFLSAVSLEGSLPSSGSASVAYGCGDGNVVIVQENGNPSGNNAQSSSGLTLANLGACSCRRY